jgi:hypothetical protein
MRINSRIVSATILTLGLLFCSIIITGTWRSASRSQHVIEVGGSAKINIVSDIGMMQGIIMVTEVNQRAANAKLKQHVESVLKYLESKGISRKNVVILSPSFYTDYEYIHTLQGTQSRKVKSYSISQPFRFKSDNVQLIRIISMDIDRLINEDIMLSMGQAEYYYNNIAGAKTDAQAEASQDARQKAERIAEATGSSLGRMRSAKVGEVKVRPRNSNIIDPSGLIDNTAIDKEVYAEVLVSFEID